MIGICFLAQYSFALINLNPLNSPRTYPENLNPNVEGSEYPIGYFIFPLYYKFDILRNNIEWTYFFSMSLEWKTLLTLFLDFINLWIVTMYFYFFRNPILRRTVKKIIFWKSDLAKDE